MRVKSVVGYVARYVAKYVAGLSALLILAACSTSPPKQVDMSSPSGVQTELTPDAQHAVLVLKSHGQPMIVKFTNIDDEGVEHKLGSVFDVEDLKRELLPSIVRMISAGNRSVYGALPVREVLVDTSSQVRLFGQSTWSDTTGTKATGLYTRSGSCGPLYSNFQPKPMKRYMVRFAFTGGSCVQQVFDITDAEAVLVSGNGR